MDQINKDKIYMISRIKEESKNLGLNPVIEFSGSKGYHFWFFMDRKTSATAIRIALKAIVETVISDLSCFDLEIFPKQDYLTGKGFGNLVKLPLGLHKLSGKRSFFLDCNKKDAVSQLAWLAGLKKCHADILDTLPEKISSKNLTLHPLIHLKSWQQTAKEKTVKCQQIENLADAVENMKTAIIQLEKFIQN